MKYARLTKEQFEELHQEFITFLATQSITSKEWSAIKEKKPEVAEQELDIFSDLVWEGALSKAKYLQNSSPQQLFMFHLAEVEMHLIAIKVENDTIDITTQAGLDWLQEHIKDESVTLYEATKAYSEDKKQDIFQLIQQGAAIVNGEWYRAFHTML